MERKFRYAWWGILVLLILAALWKFFLPHGSKVALEKASSDREIIVYVAGAVEKPGLIHLPVEARLNDALKQVSLLPEANLALMNPAERLKDGQKITVPYKPVAPSPIPQGNVPELTTPNAVNTPSTAVTLNSGTIQGSTAQGMNPNAASGTGISTDVSRSTSPSSSSSSLININTAGIAELDKLPGIGPALAERIIQYRNEHGAFGVPEDLQKVSGIGAKTYEKMASMISVGP